jgi:hypothetical protein
MASTKQVDLIRRLADQAWEKSKSHDVGYALLEVTNGRDYKDLSNAEVNQVLDMLREEIAAERCEHCGEKLPPPTSNDNRMTRAQHSLVDYYGDGTYGPNCGLS